MVNVIGLGLGIWLTVIDIKYYDGILYKVDKGDRVVDLINSPKESKKELLEKSLLKLKMAQSLTDYKIDGSARETLKRSIAKNRPY